MAETDYLWAPAPNPFSSLAWFARYPSRTDEPRSLLPPALRDVALRNVVYREVNDTLKALRVTLAHLQVRGCVACCQPEGACSRCPATASALWPRPLPPCGRARCRPVATTAAALWPL